jgi:hypothetical protein
MTGARGDDLQRPSASSSHGQAEIKHLLTGSDPLRRDRPRGVVMGRPKMLDLPRTTSRGPHDCTAMPPTWSAASKRTPRTAGYGHQFSAQVRVAQPPTAQQTRATYRPASDLGPSQVLITNLGRQQIGLVNPHTPRLQVATLPD